MKKIFALVLLLTLPAFAGPSTSKKKTPAPTATAPRDPAQWVIPPGPTCEILRNWFDGDSLAEICADREELNQGQCTKGVNEGQIFCELAGTGMCGGVRNLGQGICNAMNGSFCTSVKELSQGICQGMGQANCLNLTAADDKKWKRRLRDACRP